MLLGPRSLDRILSFRHRSKKFQLFRQSFTWLWKALLRKRRNGLARKWTCQIYDVRIFAMTLRFFSPIRSLQLSIEHRAQSAKVVLSQSKRNARYTSNDNVGRNWRRLLTLTSSDALQFRACEFVFYLCRSRGR